MTKKELQAALDAADADLRREWRKAQDQTASHEREIAHLNSAHRIALDGLNHRAGLLAQQHQAELDMIRRKASILAREEAFKQVQAHYEKIIGHLAEVLSTLAGAANVE